MIATRPKSFDAFLASEDFSMPKGRLKPDVPLEMIVPQETSYDLVIMAVTAVAVICVLAVTLGWEIALIIVAGIVANTIGTRRARRSAA